MYRYTLDLETVKKDTGRDDLVRSRGVFKWWDAQKEYGFVEVDGESIFFGSHCKVDGTDGRIDARARGSVCEIVLKTKIF